MSDMDEGEIRRLDGSFPYDGSDELSVIDRLTAGGYMLRLWRSQCEPAGLPTASLVRWKGGETFTASGKSSSEAIAKCLEKAEKRK